MHTLYLNNNFNSERFESELSEDEMIEIYTEITNELRKINPEYNGEDLSYTKINHNHEIYFDDYDFTLEISVPDDEWEILKEAVNNPDFNVDHIENVLKNSVFWLGVDEDKIQSPVFEMLSTLVQPTIKAIENAIHKHVNVNIKRTYYYDYFNIFDPIGIELEDRIASKKLYWLLFQQLNGLDFEESYYERYDAF